MTNATDHLAAYRSKQTLSIHEAACLIENTSPNMRFARRDPPVEERHLVAKIEDWKRALREAAQAGNPLLGIAIQYDSVFVPNRRDSWFVTNFATEQRPTGTYKKSEAWARTTVERPNLIAWLDSIGHRPAFFFPPETDKPLTTTERETLLGIIAVLAEMAGIDLQEGFKKYTAANKVLPHAAARKMKVTSETLANKLSEARELINPKGPVLPDPKSD